jgi:methyl-accepting chemotaxis protein WspA
MQIKMNFIHRFFLKFNYTTKSKFIYVLGNLPLSFLVIMGYYLIYKPLETIESQLEGAAYLKPLSAVFENMLKALALDDHQEQMNVKDIHMKIEGELTQLSSQKDKWPSYLKNKQTERFDSLKIDFQVFQETWMQLKNYHNPSQKDIQFQSILVGLFTSYHHLVTEIAYLFDLTQSHPAALRSLVYTLIQDMPKIQMDLAELLTSSEALPDVKEKQERLKNDMASLQHHVLQALKLISEPNVIERIDKAIDQLKLLHGALDSLELYPSPALNIINKQGLALLFPLDQQLNSILQEGLKAEKTSMQHLLWLCVFFFIIAELSVALTLFNRITRHPLYELVEGAKLLAKGNLSVRIPVTTEDEVGELTRTFNSIADYHENILKKATEIIVKIFQASTKIADLAKVIESNMTAQEQMVNQIAEHSHIIQTEVKEYANLIDNVNREAAGANLMIQHGHIHLYEMETVMHEMLNAVTNIVKTLSSLQEKITDINKVISAIVQIADQSNLLSLNTAIRAKKSGLEGRGFIVIAVKIREMADQIASATLDIEQSIKEIFGAFQETVTDVGDFSGQILKQFEETKAISDQLKHLIDSTQQQVKDFEKINQGIQCQTQQEEAINIAINDLEANIQVTAFSVHRLYLEIEYLHEASQKLHEKTKQFTFST